jgi:heme-degrading monooxygenase HmoA
MFMRISWGRLRPGRWDEYESRYQRLSTGDMPGPKPRRRWLLRDLESPDAGYTVSLWDSETDMRSYSTDPAVRARIEAEFRDLFTGEYTPRLCEVRREQAQDS